MKRTFEISLDVPADFDATYNPPYVLGSGCVITNGVLAWNVYADPVTTEPQWRKARASDEGKQVRYRDNDAAEWAPGKLLHFMSGVPFPYLVLNTNNNPGYYLNCEVQV
jgi:hypothetical protein